MVNIEGLQIGPNHPVRIMGVINLSPESFYKGNIAKSTDEFQIMVERLVSEGADIIDIGGASTAPKNVYGTSDITREKEIKRVTLALRSIDGVKRSISIDTLPISSASLLKRSDILNPVRSKIDKLLRLPIKRLNLCHL